MTIHVELKPPLRGNDGRSARLLQPIYKSPSFKARIGLILTSNDEIADDAFRSLMPSDVLVLSTRTVYLDDEPGEDRCYRRRTDFAEVAEGFPRPGRIDVLAFSCTSGTIVTGADQLENILKDAMPEAKPTAPGIAAVAAMRALGVQRLALATPYDAATHDLFVPFFEREGLSVVADGRFDQGSTITDLDITSLSPDAWFSAARELTAQSGAEAFFISCTASNVVPLIPDLEAELGIPVVTSTQAMAWHALKLVGYHNPAGTGSLFRTSS